MRLVHALVVLLAVLSLGRAAAQSLPTEVFIQAGHSSELSRIAISPDGTQLATASFDGTVKLWDVATRREIYTVREHISIVNGVAFTPDGRFLLSAGAEPDRRVLVTERASGRVVQRLAGHPKGVSAVAPLPDNRRAVSVGEEGRVTLWDLEAGKAEREWTFDIPWITSVAVAPDGASALLGAANGRILRISLADGAILREYPKQNLMVAQVAFDPAGRYVATAAGGMMGQTNPAITLWPLDGDAPLRQLAGPPGTVLDLAVSRDGETIVAGGGDTVMGMFNAYQGSGSGVWVWNAVTGELRERWLQATRTALDRTVTSVAIAPDGRGIAYARKDRIIEWRALGADAATVARFDGRAFAQRRLAVTPDGAAAGTAISINDARIAGARRRTGATASATQFHGVYRVARWNLRTGVREQAQDAHNNGIAALVADARNGLRSLSAIRDYAPVDPAMRLAPECADAAAEACTQWILAQKIDSPAHVLRDVVDADDGTSRRSDWSWHPLIQPGAGQASIEQRFAYLQPANEAVVAVSPSGARVAIALQVSPAQGKAPDPGADRPFDIAVFAHEGGAPRLVATLRSEREVKVLAFTRDERALLAGVCEPTTKEQGICRAGVRLSRVDIEARLWTRAAAASPDIAQIALSPDGKFAVTTGDYGALGWNTTDLSLVATLREQSSAIRVSRRAAWSPDQSRLAVASFGRTIRLWDTKALKVALEIGPNDGNVDALAFTPDGRRLLALTDDGALRIFDAASGALVATMTEFDDGEWITVVPEGYFVGSGAGDRQLNVRHGDRVYGMDQFYDVFYRPDIVERKLAGEKIDDLITVTIDEALRRPPPRVELGAPVPGDGDVVRVRVSARNAGGGVGEVRVFHNGKLVASAGRHAGAKPAPRLDAVPPAEQNARGLQVVLRRPAARARPAAGSEEATQEVEVRLAPGENRVWATAFNADDTLQSRPMLLELPSRPEEPPRVFVLAIGVDRYVNAKEFAALRYAVKDARDVSGQLRERFARVVPGGAVDVRLLEDSRATLASVEGELERLRREMRPGDVFVWFIASHGVLDAEAGYNVVLHDADVKQPGRGVLSTARMLDWLKRLPPLNQVLVLDTCHAGGLDSVVRGLYDARIGVLARSMGLHILASASATESAIDGYKGNGLFTHSILQGMNDRASDTNEDGRLTVTELGRFSRQLTSNIARQIRFRQNPMVFHFGRDLVVSGF